MNTKSHILTIKRGVSSEKWCASRQVDNRKNKSLCVAQFVLGNIFMLPIAFSHDIPVVLIYQDHAVIDINPVIVSKLVIKSAVSYVCMICLLCVVILV